MYNRIVIWFSFTASLVIIETTYPWYFHEGETLTLVCEDDTRTTLTWNRKTAGTSWVDVPINPVAGSNFSTASCSVEPAGKTGNTLSKTSLTLADRGTFKCSNTRSETYAVYINVLSGQSELYVLIIWAVQHKTYLFLYGYSAWAYLGWFPGSTPNESVIVAKA